MICLTPREFADTVYDIGIRSTCIVRPNNLKQWMIVVTANSGEEYPLCNLFRKPERFKTSQDAEVFAARHHFRIHEIIDHNKASS